MQYQFYFWEQVHYFRQQNDGEDLDQQAFILDIQMRYFWWNNRKLLINPNRWSMMWAISTDIDIWRSLKWHHLTLMMRFDLQFGWGNEYIWELTKWIKIIEMLLWNQRKSPNIYLQPWEIWEYLKISVRCLNNTRSRQNMMCISLWTLGARSGVLGVHAPPTHINMLWDASMSFRKNLDVKLYLYWK
jgi:hypothetical protein